MGPREMAKANAVSCFYPSPNNFIPNDKNLNWSKLKAFADDNINLKEKLKIVLGRVEIIVRNRHFLLFQQCFQKPSLSGSLKVGIVWHRVNHVATLFMWGNSRQILRKM